MNDDEDLFDLTDPILEFRGHTRWLSNFQTCSVEFEGEIYPSTEHAYMAAKTTNPLIRSHIKSLKTAREAKAFGRIMPLRDNWEDMKFNIMLEINRRKYFDNPALGKMLLDTGDAYLEEGNSWNDRYWGVCPVGSGKGQNNLGKIIMIIRDELKMSQVMTENGEKHV